MFLCGSAPRSPGSGLRGRPPSFPLALGGQHAPQEKGPASQPTRQLRQVLPEAGDTRDQAAAAQLGIPDVRWFIEAHRTDFTTRPQAERWFDAEAKRLSQLPHPATVRGVFEGSSTPDSPRMTVRQSLDEHRKGIEAGTQRVKRLDRHYRPSTFKSMWIAGLSLIHKTSKSTERSQQKLLGRRKFSASAAAPSIATHRV